MSGLAVVLVAILLLNLLVAVWLVVLALLDRHQTREAAKEIEDLERTLALASAESDVVAIRRLGGRGTTAVRARLRSPHRAIVGRGSPGLPRLVGRAGISVALAATGLWVAIAVPDLGGGRQTITSADEGSSIGFPQAGQRPTYRGTRSTSDPSDPGEGATLGGTGGPDVSTNLPPSTAPRATTDPDFEGQMVPARVAAKSRSSTAITLVWATVPGATAYQVERWADEAHWQAIATVEEETIYLDTGLEADTTYYYRVAALIEEVLAPPSNIVSATTSIAPPAATTLTVTETATTVQLTWVDVADEDGYRIERSLDGTDGWVAIGTTGQDVTAYSDSALSSGVKYEYRIVATNAGGESAPSNVVSAKINIPAAPSQGGSPGSVNGSASIEDAPPASEESLITAGDQ